jgi:hypothetical protein
MIKSTEMVIKYKPVSFTVLLDLSRMHQFTKG